MSIDRSLTVDFEAATGGKAPLTWGQLNIWRPLQWFGESGSAAFNVTRTFLLDAPVPESAVAASLRRLVERHQATRTHFRPGADDPDDPDHPDHPYQHVERAGTYLVDVVRCPTDEVRATAEALADRLAELPFRLPDEWPLRFGLVEIGGEQAGPVAAIAIAASHVAADGAALDRLIADWGALLAGVRGPVAAGATAGAPGEDWQPLDHAAYEQSDRGRQANGRALGRWRTLLSSIPASMFDLPPGPGEPAPFQRWELRSAAVAAAAQALGDRTGASASTVLLTTCALVLNAITGHDTAALQLIAANRYTARQQALVAAAAQDGLFVLRAESGDLAGTIRRAYRLATEAYFYAHYDPDALAALKAEVELERGVHFDLSAYFNDARRGQEWPTPSPAECTRPALEGLRADSELIASGAFERHDMRFYALVQHAPHTAHSPHACRLSLLADTRYVPVATIQAALRGIEVVLCEAVVDEVDVGGIAGLVGLAPPPAHPEWVPTAGGRAHPAAVADAVRSALGLDDLDVEVAIPPAGSPGPGGPLGRDGLVAYLSVDALERSGAGVDLGEAHRRVVAALAEATPGTVAPARYVVCRGRPTEPGPDGWRRLPVVTQGTGRPGRRAKNVGG